MKPTPEEKEKKDIEEQFRERIEFKQWVSRMTEIYIDVCDDEEKEPTTEGFISFLNDN